MPQQRNAGKRHAPDAPLEHPSWVQEPLLVLDDSSLRKSALVRVSVTATLDGRRGLQELGYEIVDLNTDATLALAHNVTPGDVWDNSLNFSMLAQSQHQRARRLLLPF